MSLRVRIVAAWLPVVGVLAALLVPPARAANSISVGSLTLTSNFNTAQFKLAYTGDDNSNATVLVRYSKGGSAFSASSADTAVVPFRDTQTHRFTGVIFWLGPDTTYFVHVDVTDADGGSGSVEGSITTRANPDHAIPASADSLLFVSPSGSDSNPGTQASPKKTIMGAVLALGNSRGQVRLLPGIYYETAWLEASGTPTKYYSIVGHGSPDSVIVDGSEPTLLNTTWTKFIDGHGLWSNNIYYKVFANASSVANIVAGWGQRLHTKTSWDEINNFAAHTDYPQQGWYRHNDTLFVRLENGLDPDSTTMHVAVRLHGLRITGDYWRAESLTVRFTSDKGFFLGAYNNPDSTATGAVIRNCRGYSIGLQAVYGNIGTHSVTVDSCTFEDGRVGDWSYFASKSRFEENVTGVTTVGHQTVVRNCSFRTHSDGVQVTGAQTDTTTKEMGGDSDIYYNTFGNIADDSIENDGSQGVNQAIWGNWIRGSIHGFSPVPMYTGPVYVLYNIFDTQSSSGLKMGGGNTAAIFYDHNTLTSATCYSFMEAVGGTYKNQVFRNNILTGVLVTGCYRYPLMDYAPPTMDTTVTTFGALFDNDVWKDANPWGGFAQWNGITRPWSYLQSALGWEPNGFHGTPAYTDSAIGNFTPTAGSYEIDKGAPIQGINTRNKTGGRLYTGLPDVGAVERGVTTPGEPPGNRDGALMSPIDDAPELTFAILSSRPNPTRDGAIVRMVLPVRTRVDAAVYDVAGRRVRVIANGLVLSPGARELVWSGRRDDGGRAAAGVYFIRVRTPLGGSIQRIVKLE